MAAVNGTERTYGKVLISLENCVLSPDKLHETPSVRDGLDKNVEIDLRIVGCEFIQASGVLLKLPQVAMATGQVLFQRFYYSKSFVKHDAEVYAMACIFLAAKIEEAPRRIRDVINVFHFIKQRRNNRTIQPMEYMGNFYFNRKNQVVKAERRILKELGFCVHVKHPHKIIITYLQILECETNQQLAQQSWNYMNDSLRTNVFVRFSPESIACACIFLSSRLLEICLPNNPPWYELFDASLSDLEEISLTLLELYARPRTSLENLLKKVAVIHKQLEEKKKKKEGVDKDGKLTPQTSPQSASQQGSRTGSRSTSPTTKTSPSVEEAKRKTAKNDEVKKNDSKDRHQTRRSRRSRSPRQRHRPESKSRSASRSPSRSKSRSRSRSRSYSLSISPDSHSGGSESLSSDGEQHTQSPERRSRSAQRQKDHKTKDKKSKVIPNSYLPKRDKPRQRKKNMRDRSRSPRSRSRSRERTKRYFEKYGRDRNRDRDYHRDRNGVDHKSRDREDGGRDHSRRYR